MATQQGLAFLSGGEAQEALSDPSQPEGVANANTSSAQHVGPDRHPSGRQSFEALSRLSHQTNSKTAATAGGTSRQAIYKAQVQTTSPSCLSLQLLIATIRSWIARASPARQFHSCNWLYRERRTPRMWSLAKLRLFSLTSLLVLMRDS